MLTAATGTLDAFLMEGGQRIPVSVRDPLGRPVEAAFGLLGDTAVIEMALASGLELLRPDELDPLRASTYGTGAAFCKRYWMRVRAG